ncbi:beta-eliminating lyase-related protein [Kitasatospora sp. GP82]|uniref:threonine aldolase family protein n=1 Tax=Kitasatospora sp. GP82 TaxID=3035089 RepID=UPI0024756FB8|nr:beta-eliminating lyase-related protein [Kitasatospora sp. GP82]
MGYEPDTASTGGPRERRFAAFRRSERLLSGVRPQSIRERLTALSALHEPSTDGAAVYDLDQSPDFYGDGLVRTLEGRVADLLGKPDALFFPTGTMAQQVALRIWAERSGNHTVAMHPLAHTEVHERRAYARLSGLDAVWPTTGPRLPTATELLDLGENFGTLMVELPLRDVGFLLPTWPELVSLTAAARERGAAVHLDGARLWESTSHLGRTLPQIADLADSVYVSFYKTLGGISGAALAGPEDFVREARSWRHRYGGQLFQQWPAALAALAGLGSELPRLDAYVAHARTVAAALAEVPGARVFPEPPHTHQFQLWLPHPAKDLDEAGLRLAEEEGLALFWGWSEPGLPGLAGHSMIEVTVAAEALDWTAKEITEAMAAFLALL